MKYCEYAPRLLQFMFVFSKNEQDISLIIINYCSVLLILFHFLHECDFLLEWDKIEQ